MAVNILKGNNAELDIVDGTGGTRKVTTAWAGGHPEINFDVVDVSAFSDAGHRSTVGLKNTNVVITFFHETQTAGTSAMEVCSTLLNNNSSARAIIYYPNGTQGGDPKLSVQTIVTSISWGGGVGDALTADVTFTQDGTWVYATV